MSIKESLPKHPSAAAADPRTPATYEPPRIVSKRSVERITLLSQQVPGPGPGSGIGGQ
jgi:hypothetical protein